MCHGPGRLSTEFLVALPSIIASAKWRVHVNVYYIDLCISCIFYACFLHTFFAYFCKQFCACSACFACWCLSNADFVHIFACNSIFAAYFEHISAHILCFLCICLHILRMYSAYFACWSLHNGIFYAYFMHITTNLEHNIISFLAYLLHVSAHFMHIFAFYCLFQLILAYLCTFFAILNIQMNIMHI